MFRQEREVDSINSRMGRFQSYKSLWKLSARKRIQSIEGKRFKKGEKGWKPKIPKKGKTRKRISLVKDEVYPNITSNKEIPLSTQP